MSLSAAVANPTIVVEPILYASQLQPPPVQHLVREQSAEEDLGQRQAECAVELALRRVAGSARMI